MTLNRKFGLKYINQRDVIPLTQEAKDYINELNQICTIDFNMR